MKADFNSEGPISAFFSFVERTYVPNIRESVKPKRPDIVSQFRRTSPFLLVRENIWCQEAFYSYPVLALIVVKLLAWYGTFVVRGGTEVGRLW